MYQYFISIGFWCGVAAALEKYNLRSASSPFDWCFSEFCGVLELIKNDFTSFLNIENLHTRKESPLEFEDVRYQIYFNHEQGRCLKDEYLHIFEKYQRRIRRFKEMIKKRCCFIRAIRHVEEANYIIDNSENILTILRSGNQNSDIIYICEEDIASQIDVGRIPNCYIVKEYRSDIEGLRGAFDTNSELTSFLKKHSNIEEMKANKIFELEKEIRTITNEFEFLQDKYKLLKQIITWDSSDFLRKINRTELIIYGAGDIGKAFYERIKEYREILCFIDEYTQEKEYQGVTIKKIGVLAGIKKGKLIITAMGQDSFIIEAVKCINSDLEIMTIDSVLKFKAERRGYENSD